jgi:hypothetical protein
MIDLLLLLFLLILLLLELWLRMYSTLPLCTLYTSVAWCLGAGRTYVNVSHTHTHIYLVLIYVLSQIITSPITAMKLMGINFCPSHFFTDNFQRI